MTAAFKQQRIHVKIKYKTLFEKFHFTITNITMSMQAFHQVQEKQISTPALKAGYIRKVFSS